MFITEAQAHQAASAQLADPMLRHDHLFAPWSESSVGQPVLVYTLFGKPSYWLVPIEKLERVIGFVRVMGTGEIGAYGVFYRDPARLETSPTTVTGISAEEARQQAAPYISLERNETAAAPIFVHDGPPGLETWLVEISQSGCPTRWLFVASGGVYERRAGTQRDEGLE